MADGTPIGALLVRVGADIGDFIDGLDKADKATDRFTRQIDRRLLEPLAKISAASAAAGAAVFAFTKGAADMADELGKLSQKVGVSVEGLSGLKYAADLSNLSLDQLGTGLKQLSKFMVENKIEGVGVEEQLLRIADEFSRATDNENKAAAAMKYFGKSGADLIPLLNQGRAGIEELRKEAERLGIVFSGEAAKRAEEFNDNLTRLKATAQGLQVHMAGPMVEALNSASKAMLEAQQRGEGLFTTLIEGWRRLATGDDIHKANVEIAKLGDELVKAQDRLTRARNGDLPARPGKSVDDDIRDAQARVAAIEEEIRRKTKIRDEILAPPASKEEQKRSGSVAVPEDMAKAQADREFLAKQLQEGLEEEQRIQLEAYGVMAEMRNAELERERAWREQRTQIALEYAEIELAAYEDKLRQEAEAMDAHERREKEMQATRLNQTKTFFGNVALLMNTNSKKMFEVGKQAAIAETVINTYKAAMGAYSAMASIPYVGPFLGAAAAAAAIVFGVAQVNAIRSQSFGGGGGAAPVAAASPTTGQPVGTPGGNVGATGGGRGPDTFISLEGGDVFDTKSVRALLKRIESVTRDGGRVFVVEPA